MNEKENFLIFLKKINWKQLFILFLFQLIPTIYKTVRISFLGTIPDESTYNIASQILWLNILYEIIIESIIVPIFFIFEKILKNSNQNSINTIGRFYTLITIIIFGFFLLFTFIIFFNIPNIINSFNFEEDFKVKTIEYIRLEVFGMFFFSMMSYLFLTIYLLKVEKQNFISFIIIIFYTITNLLLDLFFVSELPFSLKLGINGVGINSIISNFLISLILFFYFCRFKTKLLTFKGFFKKDEIIIKYMKKYLFLWLMSAFEVLIRNLIFYFMVIVPINQINDSGIYWIANNFIWGWLLIPITTLSNFIKINYVSLKKYSKDNVNFFKYQIMFYILFTTFIIILWFSFLWVNPIFIKTILGEKEIYIDVNNLVLILIGFYVVFLMELLLIQFLSKQEGYIYI